ncbi:MAG: HAD-IIIA family hydrolase [Candidatus Baltobacteraceae bacterium]
MIRAVLFDRDGTLIADDPASETVKAMRGAVAAVEFVRECGLKVGVVTNQPQLAGDLGAAQRMQRTHALIEQQFGQFDGWFVCAHAAAAHCACRKPQPGLIMQAAQAFGVGPHEIAVIGDIGSDVEAARAAGAFAVMVPTSVTLAKEIACAPVVCNDAFEAVVAALGRQPR